MSSRTRSFASPCIRSSLAARNHDSACTERPSIGRTHLRFGAWSKHCSGHVHPSSEAKAPSSLQDHTIWNQTRLKEPPQGHDQFARQSNNRNTAEAALGVRHPLAVPDGKPAFRLMAKP